MKKSLILAISICIIILMAFYTCKSDKDTFLQEKRSESGIALLWNPKNSFSIQVNPPDIYINDTIVDELAVDKSTVNNDSTVIYYRFSFPGGNGSLGKS